MEGVAVSGVSGDDDDNWRPVDDMLNAARRAMRSGQMIHPLGFQLYHSMNALQILDPKMDVGMAPPVGEQPMKPMSTLISEGRAPLDLSDDDQVYVFDALLACEATWHCGQALATTVYTCLYMHDSDRLEACRGPVIKAYFDATRCAVATVRHAVSQGDVWEEEDFVLHIAGFDVGTGAIGDDDGGEDQKASKKAQPKKKEMHPALAGLIAAEAWLVDNSGVEDRNGGLMCRVRFRIALHNAFEALFSLNNPQKTMSAANEARTFLDQALSDLERMKKTKSERRVNNGTNMERTDSTSETPYCDANGLGFDRKINLGLMGPSPPRVVSLMTIQKGFAYFEKLLGELKRVCDVSNMVATQSTPLHELTGFLSWTSDFSPSIVSRSFLANAVLHPKQGGILGKHPGDLGLRSAWLFTGKAPPRIELPSDDSNQLNDDLGGTGDAGAGHPEPDRDAVSRTVGGEVCGTSKGDGDDASDDDANLDALSVTTLPGHSDVTHFLNKTGLAVELLVRAYLSNRSRSRRKLRRLLGEWAVVVEHAAVADQSGFVPSYLDAVYDADDKKQSSELSTANTLAKTPYADRVFQLWSGGVLVRAMLAHITLGFTLELYLPHELTMVYWYQDYLMEWLRGELRVAEVSLQTHLEAATRCEEEEKEKANSSSGKKKKGGKKDKGSKSTAEDADDQELTGLKANLMNLQVESRLLQVHGTMCKGMIRLTCGLRCHDRHWRPRMDDFTDSEQNFWQRFGVFHSVKDPAPLSFLDFKQYTTLGEGVTVDTLFSLAAECFASVRSLCQMLLQLPEETLSLAQREDLVGLDKTAAANAAAAKLAAAAPNMRAEFAHAAHHPTFPTVKMKREG